VRALLVSLCYEAESERTREGWTNAGETCLLGALMRITDTSINIIKHFIIASPSLQDAPYLTKHH